eukprot:2583189-Amphidinium_carterae.1
MPPVEACVLGSVPRLLLALSEHDAPQDPTTAVSAHHCMGIQVGDATGCLFGHKSSSIHLRIDLCQTVSSYSSSPLPKRSQ